jgi:hypothetical protein
LVVPLWLAGLYDGTSSGRRMYFERVVLVIAYRFPAHRFPGHRSLACQCGT